MALLFVYLFIALFTSFLCSIVEATLLSTPVSYLKSRIDNGDQSAEAMLAHKEDIDRPLSAILSLNTAAHTIGAAGVGVQASLVFGDQYFDLVSAVLTILILTEIIPKTLGANYSRSLVGIAAKLITGMVYVTYPLVVVSSVITRALSKNKEEHTISREEVSALASIGTEEGIFAENENKIIQNLIKLNHVRVAEIMTPRVVIVSADEDMALQTFLENKEFLHFSRIPVYHVNKDNITGYVFRAMVFEKLAEGHFDLKLKDIKREILTFHKNTTLFNAWDIMLSKREHISIVVDEYGGIDGIVTLEDIIESLLGFEIIDEKDKVDDMQQFALERWKERQTKYQLLKPNDQ